MAELQAANSTAAAKVSKEVTTDPSPNSDLPEASFKGGVTILAIDGSQLTFSSDDPKATLLTSGVAIVDATSRWMDGATLLDTAPTLQVGQHVGLATAAGSDGVDRILFIDIAAVTVDAQAADPKTDNKTEPANSTTVDESGAPVGIDLPGPSVPPGPTEKSRGTIVAADATSISVTAVDASGQERTFAIDVAGTPFYADGT